MEGAYNLGDSISAEIFVPGEVVDVTGTSKGKGFQGVIKRHNQSRGPMTHGSRYHRGPGSMGTMRPMRVLKGKNLPGHMGNETVTVQNLEVIEVNVNENYILVSGNVPGPKNGLVLVKSSAKGLKNKTAKEIISYEEVVETVVDEVVTEEVAPVVEETVTEETPVEDTPVAEEPVVEETATEEVTEVTEEKGE